MKFLLITLIALCTLAGLAQCQNSEAVQRVRDQLLGRANFLITLVTGEIKLQVYEGRPLVAEGLEAELRQLLTVELELRATQQVNSTDAQVVALERRLDAIEDRIDLQLRAIGRAFVRRQEIANLLQRTQQLVILVSETVQALRLQNRTVLALGLQEEEARLVQLEINLRATQNPVELRRLEELLVEADYRVYEIVNQLETTGGVRTKRDLKADVLARAQELITRANNAIRALQAQPGRGQAVQLIQNIERDLQLTADDLRNVTAAADVVRLEARLINQEFQLADALMSVGRPVGLNEFRLMLNTSALGLKQWVVAEITALKAENRTQDIVTLQRLEAAVNQVLAELPNVTERQALEQLEIRLAEAEFRLYEELLRLARPEAYRRQLLRIAEDLAVRVVQEIRALTNANRTLEAEGLRSQEQSIVLLDVEIRDAISLDELRVLESRLQNLELRVFDELVRLGIQTRSKRDLKADVIKRATELINVTNEAIKAFQTQNRTQAVTLLKNAETNLQNIITQLNVANLTAVQVGILEGQLLQAEFQLVADLRRFGRPIDINEWRDLLITRGDGLQQWAAYEIAQAKNRSVEVRRVQELEVQVRNVTAVLKNATLRSDLVLLERTLNQIEENLIAELRILGSPAIPRDTIIALERRAEELAIKLIIAIRQLFTDGRYLLAEGLQAEERNLIELDVDLRVAITPERILRVEQRLKEAEDRIAAELQRIVGSS